MKESIAGPEVENQYPQNGGYPQARRPIRRQASDPSLLNPRKQIPVEIEQIMRAPDFNEGQRYPQAKGPSLAAWATCNIQKETDLRMSIF